MANRGEIAVRAFRAINELGYTSVAVFPYEDRYSLHRQKADESYEIGQRGHPLRAYLAIPGLIEVARRSGADLFIAATESSDGYTGTVPVQVAELLGWPAVTFATHVEPDGAGINVRRQTASGAEEVACPLPAVVTVTAGVVEVRYPSFKGIMSAKSKPVETLRLADLGIDPAIVGRAGARQEVMDVKPVPARAAGRLVNDEGQAHNDIVDALASWGLL